MRFRSIGIHSLPVLRWQAFALPLRYSLRNLWVRKLTTLLTAGGMALVVFVFAAVLMLDEGLRKTLVDTGSEDNVVVTRRASGTEVQSAIERASAALVESLPQVALGDAGVRQLSKEVVVLISLNKRQVGTAPGKPSNVIIRGLTPQAQALSLRPQVRIAAGRMFRPGRHEIVVGQAIARGFTQTGLGESLRFAGVDWQVVGIIDAANSGFDSEIWGDVDQLMQAFRRPVYSSLIFRLNDANEFSAVQAAIENDPRLTLEVKREKQFYADQSAALSTFIRILGLSLSLIFSVGAVIGATITMYASVASRTGEIGTLRALGFRRSSILFSFLTESLFLSLLGVVLGLAAASLMQNLRFSTMNWQSFAELAFGFNLNVSIIVTSLLFGLTMGLLGGFFPALRAARLSIVEALRAA